MAKEIDRKGFEAWLNGRRLTCLRLSEDRERYSQEKRERFWFDSRIYEEVLDVLNMEIIDETSIKIDEREELYALSYKFSDMREA